jgi:hypothetical protein
MIFASQTDEICIGPLLPELYEQFTQSFVTISAGSKVKYYAATRIMFIMFNWILSPPLTPRRPQCSQRQDE